MRLFSMTSCSRNWRRSRVPISKFIWRGWNASDSKGNDHTRHATSASPSRMASAGRSKTVVRALNGIERRGGKLPMPPTNRPLTQKLIRDRDGRFQFREANGERARISRYRDACAKPSDTARTDGWEREAVIARDWPGAIVEIRVRPARIVAEVVSHLRR